LKELNPNNIYNQGVCISEKMDSNFLLHTTFSKSKKVIVSVV